MTPVLQNLVDNLPADLGEAEASRSQRANAIDDTPLRHAAVEAVRRQNKQVVLRLELVADELGLADNVLLECGVAESARYVYLALYFGL